MKTFGLFSLLLLFSSCGKKATSLPVLTGGMTTGQVSEISAELYGKRLEQLSETFLEKQTPQDISDYQLETLTLGLFLEASTGLGPIEATALSHLELHFRRVP
jgi:hypothetical protein